MHEWTFLCFALAMFLCFKKTFRKWIFLPIPDWKTLLKAGVLKVNTALPCTWNNFEQVYVCWEIFSFWQMKMLAYCSKETVMIDLEHKSSTRKPIKHLILMPITYCNSTSLKFHNQIKIIQLKAPELFFCFWYMDCWKENSMFRMKIIGKFPKMSSMLQIHHEKQKFVKHQS